MPVVKFRYADIFEDGSVDKLPNFVQICYILTLQNTRRVTESNQIPLFIDHVGETRFADF